jgi:hypothetical protein
MARHDTTLEPQSFKQVILIVFSKSGDFLYWYFPHIIAMIVISNNAIKGNVDRGSGDNPIRIANFL